MIRSMLAVLLSIPLLAQAQEPAEWTAVPGASAEFVKETVFGGRVMLYRAGPREGKSFAHTVVLVHGLGKSGARDWSKLIPALADRYEVLSLDLPGFGQSDKGNQLYSPANYAKVLEQVVAPRVHAPFTLIGHSMGGAVSLAYSAAYPKRVSRLVLVDVAGVLHRSVYSEFLARAAAQRAIGLDSPWFEVVTRAIQLRTEMLPLRGDLLLERASVRQRVLRGDPNAIAAYALIEHEFNEALRGIKAPTLLIWGGEDSVAPLRTGQALASLIPGARLTVMEGAGHTPQLEFPQRFNPLVIDELDGRQMAAQAYALPRAPIQGNRIGRCDGHWQEFTGDYERIELENCADASITNARVGILQAAHSSVRMANSHVRDGIDAVNSRMEINGGIVGGNMALDATTIDAAGVLFEPQKAVATNKGGTPVILRLSVSQVSLSGYAPRYLHDILRLAPGEMLIR